jgi:hypothetical protein
LLERTLSVRKLSSPSYLKEVDLCHEHGLVENLAFENFIAISELRNEVRYYYFLFNVVILNSRHVKSHPKITHIPHLICEIPYVNRNRYVCNLVVTTEQFNQGRLERIYDFHVRL